MPIILIILIILIIILVILIIRLCRWRGADVRNRNDGDLRCHGKIQFLIIAKFGLVSFFSVLHKTECWITAKIICQIKYGHLKTGHGWTFGGYSSSHTVHQVIRIRYINCKRVLNNCFFMFLSFSININPTQRFIVAIPEGFPLEAAGPVFCAGRPTSSSSSSFDYCHDIIFM